MDPIRSLLAQRHLSVITRLADSELTRIHDIIEHKALVDGRTDLEELLGRLLGIRCDPVPKTLDLIGHSTPGDSLLQIGDWTIDASSPTVTAFFRELADHDVLPRLGIHAVRLLGCLTADSDSGRRTIGALSDLLGLEVFGTNTVTYSSHYDSGGFIDSRSYLLVCSSDLRRRHEVERHDLAIGEAYPRTLDLDALPAVALDGQLTCRRVVATPDEARTLLGLIRRNEGAMMPGLLVSPDCEIFIASQRAESYHRLQVLLGGEFVRTYPDGDDRPGVLYPVKESRELTSVVNHMQSI
jgi:hypothetical protein